MRSDAARIFTTVVVVSQLIGCSDATSPAPSAAIRVSVKVVGVFPSDRFQIQVDDRSMTLLAIKGNLVVRSLPEGTHTVSLVGLPTSCVIEGTNPVTVETVSGNLSVAEFGVNCFAVGTLAFVSTREGAAHIYLASPDGTGIKRLTNELASEFTPAWSPDGKRLAFNSADGTYVINRDGSGLRRLPYGGAWPSWSPEGKRLLVTDSIGFRIIPVDDANERVVAVPINERDAANIGMTYVYEGTWSPDGSRIAFSAWTEWDMISLFVMNVNGSAAQRIVQDNVTWDECGPEWSPDGQSIALLSMAFRSASTVSAFGGRLQNVFAPGTSCWDNSYGTPHSQSGIGWSPDGNALAVTMRTPSWEPNFWPLKQDASIAIVSLHSQTRLASIPDAYDPTWTK